MAEKTHQSRILTLVFTDLVEAASLKDREGDHVASCLIARHKDYVRRLATEAGGREVDDAGDGFFLTFETPSSAVIFGLRLQQIHAAERKLPQVRVGIHFGEVEERPAPPGTSKNVLVEGLEVDLASRIQSLALGGQVLMSASLMNSARQHISAADLGADLVWRHYGPYLLKGFGKSIDIAEMGVDGMSPLIAPHDSDNAQRFSKEQTAAGVAATSQHTHQKARVLPWVGLITACVIAFVTIAQYFSVAPSEWQPRAKVYLTTKWTQRGVEGEKEPPTRPGPTDQLNLHVRASQPGFVYLFLIRPDLSVTFEPALVDNTSCLPMQYPAASSEEFFGTYLLDDPPGDYSFVAVLADVRLREICARFPVELAGNLATADIFRAVQDTVALHQRRDNILGVSVFSYSVFAE
ncbi:MAG: adenylate/guanylate cyclase domain-containing protein [Phycisphaerae bacterium]